jgi:hypothetical protein
MGSDSRRLTWTDPHGLVDRKARVFLYFVRVTDDEGQEYRYIGQTKGGKSRLKDYARNIDRIFAGLPRRITPGQEDYRAVHLALAKACQHDWMYFIRLRKLSLIDLMKWNNNSSGDCNAI